jgi:cellulose synthase/poly-beta-1,6-N-acetylglucosamine synthase-like glycosyltransferase
MVQISPSFHIPLVKDKSKALTLDPKLEIRLTKLAISFTLFASVMAGFELVGILLEQLRASNWGSGIGQAIFLVIVALLIYGGLVYQFTRLIYFRRGLQHRVASRDELDRIYDGIAPALTILVPSYMEDERVVYKTIMSVALQDYPNRRVTLLIDDPPVPRHVADRLQLSAMQKLPNRIEKLLAKPAQKFNSALADFQNRLERNGINSRQEAGNLANLYKEAAAWFEEQADHHEVVDHADVLFVKNILLRQRDDHVARAASLNRFLQESVGDISKNRLLREYRWLAAIFSVEITSFERKRYENLSHEPNKAMNLNSYISLVGKSLRERQENGNCYLEEVSSSEPHFIIPETDYFMTLDADSMVTSDYSLRLVHLMEQPGNERIAVAQTPYNTIPNAPGLLERIAGATTDIQYIIHQGFTGYNATYWVGANALLRKDALSDIATIIEERGYKITRYIQDRTVIEDTESTIDLVDCGWQLYNYPERLAHSATPPDFGSLIIQRRRWANGGLIILPKLLRMLALGPKTLNKAAEGFMRIHYLASITAVNAGLLILLAVPFTESIRTLWLPLTAVPYFLLYMRDLALIGYHKRDLFRVYSLNLLLIPVNLGGVLKSLQQAWKKEKIPFGRTPKVLGRTAALPLYIIVEYLLLAQWFFMASLDFLLGRWIHGMFAFGNASFLLYALHSLVGFKESKEDLLIGVRWWWRRITNNKEVSPLAGQMAVMKFPTNQPRQPAEINIRDLDLAHKMHHRKPKKKKVEINGVKASSCD